MTHEDNGKAKGEGDKERCTHLNAKFQRGEISKPSSAINAKKYKKTIEWERVKISSGKLEMPSENFMQRWAQ